MNELQEQLEALIDRHSLNTVIEALGEVAFAKSNHVAENWSDMAASKAWQIAGSGLQKLASKVGV
jgi:hypothetical protein